MLNGEPDLQKCIFLVALQRPIICSAIIHCNYCNRVIRLAAFVVHEIKDSMYLNIQINKFY